LVPPQFKSPFLILIYLPSESQVADYTLDVASSPLSYSLVEDIQIQDFDWWEGEENSYIVEGKFENQTELSEFIQIVAMFYDPQGQLVALGEFWDQGEYLFADAYNFVMDEEAMIVTEFNPAATTVELQIVGR